MAIQINKHPDGRISNIIFGVCGLGDSLVRILSLGFLHATFALDYSRHTAKKRLQRMKKQACLFMDAMQKSCYLFQKVYNAQHMKTIPLLSLPDPDGYLSEIVPVYTAMLVTAARENDLRAYCIARLMLSTLDTAAEMWRQYNIVKELGSQRVHYGFVYPPQFYYAEDTDTIEDIVSFGNRYIHNPVMAG